MEAQIISAVFILLSLQLLSECGQFTPKYRPLELFRQVMSFVQNFTHVLSQSLSSKVIPTIHFHLRMARFDQHLRQLRRNCLFYSYGTSSLCALSFPLLIQRYLLSSLSASLVVLSYDQFVG